MTKELETPTTENEDFVKKVCEAMNEMYAVCKAVSNSVDEKGKFVVTYDTLHAAIDVVEKVEGK